MTEYDSYYDTNQIRDRVDKKYFKPWIDSYQSSNSVCEKEMNYEELVKVEFYFIQSIETDDDFKFYFNNIKEQENIFLEFSQLEREKMVEILIKVFHFVIPDLMLEKTGQISTGKSS